jgi:hypothetical protein
MLETRQDLDQWKCDNPHCRHDHPEVFIVQNCHPKKGMEARYNKFSGALILTCIKCGSLVAEILVGNERPE